MDSFKTMSANWLESSNNMKNNLEEFCEATRKMSNKFDKINDRTDKILNKFDELFDETYKISNKFFEINDKTDRILDWVEQSKNYPQNTVDYMQILSQSENSQSNNQRKELNVSFNQIFSNFIEKNLIYYYYFFISR